MNPLIIGVMGMVLILIAFVLDEFVQHINQNTISYNLLNIVGSGLLLYYAVSLNGWPFVILNGVWLVVAGIKLIQVLENGSRRKRRSSTR